MLIGIAKWLLGTQVIQSDFVQKKLMGEVWRREGGQNSRTNEDGWRWFDGGCSFAREKLVVAVEGHWKFATKCGAEGSSCQISDWVNLLEKRWSRILDAIPLNGQEADDTNIKIDFVSSCLLSTACFFWPEVVRDSSLPVIECKRK